MTSSGFSRPSWPARPEVFRTLFSGSLPWRAMSCPSRAPARPTASRGGCGSPRATSLPEGRLHPPRRLSGLLLFLSLVLVGCGESSPADAASNPPQAIRASVESVSFDALGRTLVLSAVVLDAQGATIPEAEVRWWSSDPAIVAVTPAGEARSVANGSTRIHATSGAAQASIPVEVRQMLGSVEGVDRTVSAVGEATLPFPFVNPRDPNGVAIAPTRLAELLASVTVVEQEPLIPGFLPDPEPVGDSLRLRYAGRVVLELGGRRATVVYAPSAPELYGILGSTELQDTGEIRIHGPRLDEWANPDVHLSTPAVLSLVARDASSLTYRVELTEAPCTPSNARVTVSAGIPVRPALLLRRSGAGHTPVEVGVGELLRVDEATTCLGVSPGRYLVAFADLGYLQRGAVELMPRDGWDDWTAGHGTVNQVGFRVVDRVAEAAARGPVPFGRGSAPWGAAGAPGHHLTQHQGHFLPVPLSSLRSMPGAEELEAIWQRMEPLALGDRVLAPRETGIGSEGILLSPATAVHEREGFVVLVHDLDSLQYQAQPEIMEQFLDDLDRFLDRGLATYQEIFQIDYPRLGTPFGQHVVVLTLGPSRAAWNAGFLSHLRLSDFGEEGRPWTLGGRMLVHEIAHGFQVAEFEVHGGLPTSTTWSLEGGATLMETVAFDVGAVEWERFADFAAGRCGRWTNCDAAIGDFLTPLQDASAPFLSQSGPNGYFGISNSYWVGAVTPFYQGYSRSAPIMRRYAWRYSQATGAPIRESIGTVVRQSLEGFHGDLKGGPRGLIDFLRSVDPGFDPALEHLASILDTTPRKGQLAMPEEFLWHDDTKNYFAMHLLAGLGTDYTLPMDRMSHGLLTYDVPGNQALGVLELLPESPEMRYLILRVK